MHSDNIIGDEERLNTNTTLMAVWLYRCGVQFLRQRDPQHTNAPTLAAITLFWNT